jgi:hypothetical protein
MPLNSSSGMGHETALQYIASRTINNFLEEMHTVPRH